VEAAEGSVAEFFPEEFPGMTACGPGKSPASGGAPASFEELGISPSLGAALAGRDIRVPTAIQALVIPSLLAGRNVLFRSATGTGKTLAYMLPLVQGLLEDAESILLVCAPTYELCSQIKREADLLLGGISGPHPPLKAALLIGSASPERQIQGLRKNKPRILVAGPGRLLLLARMGKIRFAKLRFLVLDEGDRLVSDELFAETGELAALLPAQRLSAACSATFSARNRERILPLLGPAALITEAEDGEFYRKNIDHWALFSEDRRKIRTLRSFLSAVRPEKALIFTARGGQVGNIVTQLRHHALAAGALFGDMDRRDRKAALDDFRAGRTGILVSSDLAARGLDIPGITHVISLDVPETGEGYIHRAGRTARSGRRGVALTIGNEGELRRLAGIEKGLGIAVYPKVLYAGRLMAPEEET
jgi:superfamily II DNA/RNA helicase